MSADLVNKGASHLHYASTLGYRAESTFGFLYPIWRLDSISSNINNININNIIININIINNNIINNSGRRKRNLYSSEGRL